VAFTTRWFDNMRVAVKRFVGPTEKEPTEGLVKLSLYYQYAFRFCNTRRGSFLLSKKADWMLSD
jgi:hypothetical protein